MAEPELEQSQSVLKCFGGVRGVHLVTQGKLLHESFYRVYYMIHVLLSKVLLVRGRMS